MKDNNLMNSLSLIDKNVIISKFIELFFKSNESKFDKYFHCLNPKNFNIEYKYINNVQNENVYLLRFSYYKNTFTDEFKFNSKLNIRENIIKLFDSADFSSTNLYRFIWDVYSNNAIMYNLFFIQEFKMLTSKNVLIIIFYLIGIASFMSFSILFLFPKDFGFYSFLENILFAIPILIDIINLHLTVVFLIYLTVFFEKINHFINLSIRSKKLLKIYLIILYIFIFIYFIHYRDIFFNGYYIYQDRN